MQGYLSYSGVAQRVPSTTTIPTNRPELSVERLWTVRHGEQSLVAELAGTQRGVELRLLSDARPFASQSVGSREVAILCADVLLHDLIGDGWVTAAS